MFSKRLISSNVKDNATLVTRPRKFHVQPMFETLECRQLMSAAAPIGDLAATMEASTGSTTVDFNLNQNANLPTTYPYYIQVESEVMKVSSGPSAVVGNSAGANEYDFLAVGRGVEGSVVQHNSTATVYLLEDYTPPAAPAAQLAAPTNVTAAAVSTSQIDVQWSASQGATSSTGYLVYMWTQSTGWAPVANTGATSYNAQSLPANTLCYFCVFAYDGSFTTGASGLAHATTANVSQSGLGTPQGLAVKVVSSSQVNLSWSAVEGATQYVVQAKTQGGVWVTIGEPATNSFSRNDFSPNVDYQLQVAAVNSETDSAYAGIDALTLPPPPTGFSAQAVSGSQVNLSWNAQGGISGFLIAYRTATTGWTYRTAAAGATSYPITGLTANTDYTFYVGATNASGTTWENSQDAVTSVSGPATPTGLKVTESAANQLLLTWSAAAGASEYFVYYYNNGTWQQITTTANAYQYVSVPGSNTYYFTIIAGNQSGQYSTAAQYAGITI